MALYVTLFVFRVDAAHIRAHECLGDHEAYLGEVTIARASMPHVHPGDRIRLSVG